MKFIKYVLICLLCLSSLAAVLCVQTTSNKKLEAHVEELYSQIEYLSEKIDSLAQKVDGSNTLLLKELEKNKASSDKQFSETKKMKGEYDLLLDEQKKQRIDSAKKDTAVTNMLAEAEKLYDAKNYRGAYKKFSDVLQYQPENIDARFKKLDCLFSINPMDSTKYNEILSECDFLMKNGYSNPRLDEIKKHIEAERGAR